MPLPVPPACEMSDLPSDRVEIIVTPVEKLEIEEPEFGGNGAESTNLPGEVMTLSATTFFSFIGRSFDRPLPLLRIPTTPTTYFYCGHGGYRTINLRYRDIENVYP